MTKNTKPQDRAKNELPHFSYQSSLLMLLFLILAVTLVPLALKQVTSNYNWWTVILGGLLAGFGTVFSQYRLVLKKPLDKQFYLLAGAASLVCGFILFIFAFAGIIM